MTSPSDQTAIPAKCPRIISYESTDAGPRHRFIALFSGGKRPLPMMFYGATRDGATSSAAGFWRDQQLAEANKAAAQAARSAKFRKAGK